MIKKYFNDIRENFPERVKELKLKNIEMEIQQKEVLKNNIEEEKLDESEQYPLMI